jgi:MoxR-like ATPase
MGELLNLEICCVDCTEMKHETDLFGPKMPYRGYELGSPLNNFLARNTGKRCIVFLDELEKTTREVQNALLVPFSEGKWTKVCTLRFSDMRSRPVFG